VIPSQALEKEQDLRVGRTIVSTDLAPFSSLLRDPGSAASGSGWRRQKWSPIGGTCAKLVYVAFFNLWMPEAQTSRSPLRRTNLPYAFASLLHIISLISSDLTWTKKAVLESSLWVNGFSDPCTGTYIGLRRVLKFSFCLGLINRKGRTSQDCEVLS
jgi:hypothetical protein